MFLLRVDDCGWEPTRKANDAGLAWFRQYREHGGLAGLPVVWAFIPTTVTPRELEWMHDNLSANEHVAVHGWDHRDGATVDRDQMDCAAKKLHLGSRRPVDCYVPPFNRYDRQTIADWAALRASQSNAFFFGGFNGENHSYGAMPTYAEMDKGTIHLSAFRPLYDRANKVLERLEPYRGLKCPLVVTLHATWDVSGFGGLRDLQEALAGELAPPEYAVDWLRRAEVSLAELTAPHYVAYKWVLDRVPVGARVLDVGARYSKLPSLLSLWGARVSACDRDGPTVQREQAEIAARLGAEVDAFEWDCREPLAAGHTYDAVTACWSIQHNFPWAEQRRVVRNLAAALASRGQLLIVSSFTPDKSFEQTNRADPQLVLDLQGHDALIGESGLRLDERSWFHYEHQSVDYKWCSPAEANAVVYRLVKEP